MWTPELAQLEIESEGKMSCQLIVDRLPTSTLPPGEYSLVAALLPDGEGPPASGDSFTIVP